MRLTVNWSSSIINCEIIYQLQFTSDSHEKPKNTCNCHNPPSVQSEPDSSGTFTIVTSGIHLLATVHESQLHTMYMYRTLKLLRNFLGDSTQAGVHPSSSHKERIHPGLLIGRELFWKGGSTEVHKFLGFLGIWSAKANLVTSSPQWTQPVTRQSYPPLLHIPLGTFGIGPKVG